MTTRTVLSFCCLYAVLSGPVHAEPLPVVTTLATYASLVREVGGDRVATDHLIAPGQDPHFVKPTPSLSMKLRRAKLFVSTGLDLELWVPAVVDRSGNRTIRDGEVGFVSAAHGIPLLEKPLVVPERTEGDAHLYGCPHITNGPDNLLDTAQNIMIGLIKVDPAGESEYRKNYAAFRRRLLEAMYGIDLLAALPEADLIKLTRSGRFYEFFRSPAGDRPAPSGRPLRQCVGGWSGRAMRFAGTKVITYHLYWPYLLRFLGLQKVATVEPKNGIPPSPQHLRSLLKTIAEQEVRLVLQASFYETRAARFLAERGGVLSVVLPTDVGERPGLNDTLALVDGWIHSIEQALQAAGQLREGD